MNDEREECISGATVVSPHASSERQYWMARREALLIELRAIEKMLGIPITLTNRQREERATCKAGQA